MGVKLIAGDTIKPGDLVCIGDDGKVRRAIAAIDPADRCFRVPPNAIFDGSKMSWDDYEHPVLMESGFTFRR